MDQSTITGIATLAVPLLLVALLFRRSLAILAFYLVLLVVGIGYLTSTGAISDIGHFTLNTIGVGPADEPVVPSVPPAEKMPAPAPAP
jgi:hypothetical protein